MNRLERVFRRGSGEDFGSESGMGRFVNAVTRGQVAGALAPLSIEDTSGIKAPMFTTDIGDGPINYERIKSRHLAPSWLDLDGYNILLSRISSKAVWEELLKQSPHGIQKGVSNFLYGYDIPQAASTIEEGNKALMTQTVSMGMIGAAFGSNITEAVSHGLHFMFWQDSQASAFDVAREVGQRYVASPDTPKKLLDRVQELIPSPDLKGNSGNTLFALLAKHKVFDGKWLFGGHCPAIRLTQYMLSEYGRLLSTPEYQEKFLETVVKKGSDTLSHSL